MSRQIEIVYKDETGIEVIGEVGYIGSNGLTVDEALEIAGIDIDKYAEEHGWDGYDWNCLELRAK